MDYAHTLLLIKKYSSDYLIAANGRKFKEAALLAQFMSELSSQLSAITKEMK